MAETTTTKLINLAQLATEMGGIGLAARTSEGTTTVSTDEADQATLDAAVAAHVAIDVDSNRRTLQDQAEQALAANRTFLALASPTNAQTLAQVKMLSREANGLIRLALNLFDGTD